MAGFADVTFVVVDIRFSLGHAKIRVMFYDMWMIRYSVQLRIESPSLDTAQITKELGMSPTQTRQAGEWRSPTSIWEKALWAMDAVDDSGPEWDNLEAGLRELLQIFSPHQERIREYSQKYEVYFYCGQFSAGRGGGPSLSADILSQLGNFHVPVSLHAYLTDD